jgi:hypothetical protein
MAVQQHDLPTPAASACSATPSARRSAERERHRRPRCFRFVSTAPVPSVTWIVSPGESCCGDTVSHQLASSF